MHVQSSSPIMRGTVLITLVIYLIAALVLAASIPPLILNTIDAQKVWRETVADRVVIALGATNLDDPAAVERATLELRSRNGVVVHVYRPRENAPLSVPEFAESKVRTLGPHLVVVEFQRESNAGIRRLLRNALMAAVAASVAGLVLLARAGYDIVATMGAWRSRSIEAGGSRQLMETLESSVRTMKGRETELRRRAAELATISGTLVRSLNSGFIAFDEEGRIVDLNQAARDIAQTVPNAAGRRADEALAPSAFTTILQEAVDRREALQRVEVNEPDGRSVGLTSVPLLDDRGRHFGMLALFADLTHVRKLESRLREMQTLADLGEMSAGIAHEFRNSLSTILGYLALARKSADVQRLQQSIAKAEAESHELASAVESLLVFARPMELQRHAVDLDELVAAVSDRLRVLDGSVEVSIEAELVMIRGDSAMLSRAVENLLRNAYDAIAERGGGGRIEIRVESKPTPRITIADDGAGIDAAVASRMFLPFQSGRSSGFGVGLSLTRKIVLLHGGSVDVVPREGGGAIASIEFCE